MDPGEESAQGEEGPHSRLACRPLHQQLRSLAFSGFSAALHRHVSLLPRPHGSLVCFLADLSRKIAWHRPSTM